MKTCPGAPFILEGGYVIVSPKTNPTSRSFCPSRTSFRGSGYFHHFISIFSFFLINPINQS